MSFTTLITTEELAGLANGTQTAIVDCRFSLHDTRKGREAYLEAHIPGAVYAHLDRDLSGTVVTGQTGRHPLPDPDVFSGVLSRWGIGNDTRVVVYDDMGGAFAARLWWMMKWLGHEHVAVLDGGWQAWLAEDRPVCTGMENRPSRTFIAKPRLELVADAAMVNKVRCDPNALLLDARGEDRYRGENETIDPVAGHIPGALSTPFVDNLSADGHFLTRNELRKRFQPLQDEANVEDMVIYCGSGVTAAHNILAMAHAEMGMARLYPGSWSEWINDPARPVATGHAVFGEEQD
jgi:thiosulfate/3-mercaptopyruvate sulfurtransferase